MEEKLIKDISEIDEQLKKHKLMIDKYAGIKRGEIPDYLFDKLVRLSDLTVQLLITRRIMIKMLNSLDFEHYGEES